eukprot:1290230-Pyramimonas_sp.AAC.1
MAGTEGAVGRCVKCVGDILGQRKLKKQTFSKCAVRYAMDSDGNVILGQDVYMKQLHPIQRRELAGADAEAEASKMVAD